MSVYLAGRRLALDPSRALGKGGEADVYDLGGRALKVFKPPEHPDYQGQPEAQAAARERLQRHQQKLRAFPLPLPSRVVQPEDLATDRSGRIVGYAMPLVSGAVPLVRYSQKRFRQAGVSAEQVVATFRDMHSTLGAIHRAGVVVGDLNDLNVLVVGSAAYFIDVDSYQFGPYICPMFTAKFADPLLLAPAPASGGLTLARPYGPDSDWYAFAVLLLSCLLFVDPYGGVYEPRDRKQAIPHDLRPLQRITVFHPEVRYPKPALPSSLLPDDLLQYFHEAFERDRRGELPRALLNNLRWTRCADCGLEHARAVCPQCGPRSTAPREAARVRGRIVATTVFRTRGVVLQVAHQSGRLRVLYHEGGRFLREDGSAVVEGAPDPWLRFRLQGAATLVGRAGQVLRFEPGRPVERHPADDCAGVPTFDTNSRHHYWVSAGRLLRDGRLGPEHLGDVLAGQTRFWVGERFGFGFYRAGSLNVAFVFDVERRLLDDRVAFPRLSGHLVDAQALFADDLCWFLSATRDAGRTTNRCLLLRADGKVLGDASAEEGDGSWLGTIRGKCAAGSFLFAATDQGLARVEADSGRLVKTREYPDAEPFVDTGCELLAAPEGLYVASRQEVRLLKCV